MISLQKQIQKLRKRFKENFSSAPVDTIHCADFHRINADDDYLQRFLLHNDGNLEDAYKMLWETCEWRKEFGVNDLKEGNLKQEILEDGSIFSHGKDKDGKTLLILKLKNDGSYMVNTKDYINCFVYWLERLERQEKGEMISLFYDMDGLSLLEVDVDFLKDSFVVCSFYPHFINFFIIYEIHWVLTGILSFVKSFMSLKTVEKVVVVNKLTIGSYIDPEFILKSWGGKDYYVFNFNSEHKNVILSSLAGEDVKKKVHFNDNYLDKDPQIKTRYDKSEILGISSKLHISPSNFLVFTQEGNEVVSLITIQNEDSQNLAYKIKTTSPEKFRVRPSNGVISSGANAFISISLLPGYSLQSLLKDKFLIMSTTVKNCNVLQTDVKDIWKLVAEKDIIHHKLKCSVPRTGSNESETDNDCSFSEIPQTVLQLNLDVAELKTSLYKLKEDLKFVKKRQTILFAVTFLLPFFISMTLQIYFSSQFDFSATKGD